MAKTTAPVPADKLALYEKLVATNPHVAAVASREDS